VAKGGGCEQPHFHRKQMHIYRARRWQRLIRQFGPTVARIELGAAIEEGVCGIRPYAIAMLNFSLLDSGFAPELA